MIRPRNCSVRGDKHLSTGGCTWFACSEQVHLPKWVSHTVRAPRRRVQPQEFANIKSADKTPCSKLRPCVTMDLLAMHLLFSPRRLWYPFRSFVRHLRPIADLAIYLQSFSPLTTFERQHNKQLPVDVEDHSQVSGELPDYLLHIRLSCMTMTSQTPTKAAMMTVKIRTPIYKASAPTLTRLEATVPRLH